jgi:hypothetical protein
MAELSLPGHDTATVEALQILPAEIDGCWDALPSVRRPESLRITAKSGIVRCLMLPASVAHPT